MKKMNVFLTAIVTVFILSLLPTVTMAQETQITTNTAWQVSPAIYGDRIVWADLRSGDWDIYMYDIATGQETQITSNPSYQAWPSICGDKIVWEDDRNGGYDIYMYNLRSISITEFRITTNAANQRFPAIYGDRIVWEDNRNGNWDIYLGDLAAGKEIQITSQLSTQALPAIWGDDIVWTDDRNGNWDIYMYNIATSTETRVTTNAANQSFPAICGDGIVWQDERNGNWDIYMYNITTGNEKQITYDTSAQVGPAMYGNRIVWRDERNVNYDIYRYDITTGVETPVTTDLSNQDFPAIYENRIVWEDYRNGNADIYMYTIPQPPTADFAANSTLGVAPLTVQFVDMSTGNPTSWSWDFGDGGTSLIQNPVYTFNTAGTYTVTLTVSNALGSDKKTLIDYITVTAPPVPTIESCDWQGVEKNSFDATETAFVNGSGFQPSTTHAVYVVSDMTWTDGINIPPRVSGTAPEILSDSSGKVVPSRIWNMPPPIGKYDIIVDVNGNGKCDANVDAIDDNDVQITAGLQVIPEFPSLAVIPFFMVAVLSVIIVNKTKRPHQGEKRTHY
jgi:beta propeller repeat protein